MHLRYFTLFLLTGVLLILGYTPLVQKRDHARGRGRLPPPPVVREQDDYIADFLLLLSLLIIISCCFLPMKAI